MNKMLRVIRLGAVTTFCCCGFSGAVDANPPDDPTFINHLVAPEGFTAPKIIGGHFKVHDFDKFYSSLPRPTYTVRLAFDVTADGKIENCTAWESSDWVLLYKHICHLLKTRFKFAPAADKDARPIAFHVPFQMTLNTPPLKSS